ncbi:PilC/PilY family type IV pilus protein [Mitsuaria sp. GD03876]|uniref:pilus assembly protein n=1 Tax=Mitsuaria sp. GD03876 TaxID=2975399 RepID=UPI0024489BD2|nr:PilC/PilY family type IV pilus protein [Mitsuaria sp. GD03876]MDH0864214.1 PilC/PilY family type IV pilus protein [Mitsuaria sp. GD03876]
MSLSTLRRCLLGAAAASALCAAGSGALAQTLLADKPVFASVSVPGNLALALSVEFPTAVGNAHLDTVYNPASTYLGYFDPYKCYDYVLANSLAAGGVDVDHFAPTATNTTRTCTGKWSGNFLNWATTQTIDPFRWALTGGQRVVDTATATVIEKAWASGQGSTSNFPDRTLSDMQSVIRGATPFNWTDLRLRIQGMGNLLRFTSTGNNNSSTAPTPYTPGATVAVGTSYTVAVRARVCDARLGIGFLEGRCKQYGTNYKPEGLIQQYADQIRFSAFGYLNDGTVSRDGGVLRARQKFVGPSKPVPGGDPVDNAAKEWDSATGIMVTNPDSTDAAATSTAFSTTISNSGVMNYLNKFGASKTYKTYDPVGELYYTALRYFRNIGNVSSYTDTSGANATTKATWADGFPVITSWDDPIQYYCQKNFILGIGDVNTHADRNLPGASGASEPTKPGEVSADTGFNATTWTNMVGTMAGINNLASISPYNNPACCTNNGALMAGMAYWANTNDIRPTPGNDIKTTGKQTVQTYWLDVLEASTYKTNNQYYLATKYGGAVLPTDFDPTGRTTDLPQAYWHTGPSTDTVGSQLRPDTYYTAARPDLMVSGLTSAFASIASRMKALSTSFTNAQQSVAAGTANYASQFDAATWSGDVIASSLNVSGTSISATDVWRFSTKLDAQASGTGWKTNRLMVTVNDSTKAAVPFLLGNLSNAQSTSLNTSYRGGDAQDYLNYLRGDRTQEQSSTVNGSSKKYRDRSSLVGDIVNAKLIVVGPPSLNLSEVSNPGYSAYKAAKSRRPNVVIAGTNQGVVHVIDGSLSGATAGRELFAYIPSAVFAGPTNTPAVNGLQSLGNPNFNHYFMVDAPPVTMDVDFGNTVGGSGSDWRSIVVGGLGKGGKMIYALDVTDLDPTAMTTETIAATKVLWEFTEADMGYTFGQPLVTRTAAHGWVVIVPAGHNNGSGKNHLYIINARTGTLITRIDTPAGVTVTDDDGSGASPSGMTQVTAFYPDLTSLVAESVYAGDLRGSVWRFDLRNTPFPQGIKVARATDQANATQPITTRVLPVIQPETGRRFMVFGTGKMLSANDINSTQLQRMYAIADGSAGKFNVASDLPASVSYPIGNAKLRQLTDVTQPITIDYTQQMGWYLNVANGYRVVTDPTYFGGIVVFTATVPNNSNPCSPSGSSIVYALSLGTGQTQFTNNAAYFDPGFGVIDAQFIYTPNGPKLLISGTTPSATCGGGTLCLPPTNDPKGIGNKLLNWREIPLRNATGGIQ